MYKFSDLEPCEIPFCPAANNGIRIVSIGEVTDLEELEVIEDIEELEF